MTKADLNQNNLDLVNISVRLYRAQRDLIDEAAALVHGRSLSDYVREILTLQAALDLNRDPPRVPDISRGRGGSIVAQAAAKLGLTRAEFEEQAILYAASHALEANAIEDRRTPVPAPHAPEPERTRSTIRPAARPGMYSAQPNVKQGKR